MLVILGNEICEDCGPICEKIEGGLLFLYKEKEEVEKGKRQLSGFNSFKFIDGYSVEKS